MPPLLFVVFTCPRSVLELVAVGKPLSNDTIRRSQHHRVYIVVHNS